MKQGNALLPLTLNFPLPYSIRRVQVNQDDLKLNGIPQNAWEEGAEEDIWA